jgi:hypothetical protein
MKAKDNEQENKRRKWRERTMKHRYGITADDYDQLVKIQGE